MADPVERIAPSLLPLARPIAELTADPRNARRHDERNLAAVAESLRRFGQRVPVVARGSEIKAGHARVEAAKRLGWTVIAVADADDLTEDEARAYAIADNRTAELADWDDELLRQLAHEEPLKLVGFEQDDVFALLDGGHVMSGFISRPPLPPDEKEPSPAAVDEAPAASVSGTIYELGAHRLYCGDSTADRALGPLNVCAKDVALQIVDPPFDVAYDTWPVLGRRFWLWGNGQHWCRAMAAAVNAGYGIADFALIGQTKGQPSDYLPCRQHEVATICGRPLRSPDAEILKMISWPMTSGGRPLSWARGFSWHGQRHAKPVRAMLLGIAYTDRGEMVLDLTAGSGSSLIATARAGRVWRGAELDPALCDEIRRRWTRWAVARKMALGAGALADPVTPGRTAGSRAPAGGSGTGG